MTSCEHKASRCLNSRNRGKYRYRRYECHACGERFSTAEVRIDELGTGTKGGAMGALQIQVGLSDKHRRALNELADTLRELAV